MARVVLATDGSPGARSAVAFLIGAGLRPADVVEVVTVAEHASHPGAYLDPADLRAAAIADDAVQRLRAAGIAAVAEPAAGAAAPAITDVVIRTRADLVVIGSRGLGRWMAVMFGSVARALTHPAVAPVLVVRGRLAQLQHVVLAAPDLAALARASRALAHLPLAADADVDVIFPAQSEAPAHPWSLRLADVFDEARRLMPATDVRVHAVGRPYAAAVLAEAARAPADLIVVPMEREAPTDGTVDEVIGAAHCPVLVVPAPLATTRQDSRVPRPEPAVL